MHSQWSFDCLPLICCKVCISHVVYLSVGRESSAVLGRDKVRTTLYHFPQLICYGWSTFYVKCLRRDPYIYSNKIEAFRLHFVCENVVYIPTPLETWWPGNVRGKSLLESYNNSVSYNLFNLYMRLNELHRIKWLRPVKTCWKV